MNDTDPLTELRAADPARRLAVPTTWPSVDAFIARDDQRRTRRRRARVTIGAVAAATAAALVVPVLSFGGAGGASPAAADVLQRAAAITAVDQATSPGQFWKITTVGSNLTTVAGNDPAGGPDPVYAVYQVSIQRTDYVSVDGSQPSWTQETSGDQITQVSGPGGYQRPERTSGASTSNLAPDDIPGTWQTPTTDFLRSLPRDIAALRDRLYRDVAGHGPSDDTEVLVYVADALRSGLVPADLRVALFGVLETIPGIGGVTGIAIGRLEPRNGTRQEIVVDPATGQVVGEREVQVVAGDGPPAGTVISESRVTRTVVDRVPADIKQTAQRFECTVDNGGATVCGAS